jgi:hypothetical protein
MFKLQVATLVKLMFNLQQLLMAEIYTLMQIILAILAQLISKLVQQLRLMEQLEHLI